MQVYNYVTVEGTVIKLQVPWANTGSRRDPPDQIQFRGGEFGERTMIFYYDKTIP